MWFKNNSIIIFGCIFVRENIRSYWQYLWCVLVEVHLSPTLKQTNQHARTHTVKQTGCWCVMKLRSQQQAAAGVTPRWQMSRVEQTLLFWLLTSSGSTATHLEPQFSQPGHSEFQEKKVGTIFFSVMFMHLLWRQTSSSKSSNETHLFCVYFTQDRLIPTWVRLSIEVTFLLFCVISVFSSGFTN